MAIIEIVHWVAVNNIEAENCKLLHPVLDLLSKRKGCLGIYYGFVEEHKKKFVYFFIVWDKFEDHEELMKHPDYPQMLNLDPCIGEGRLNMNHVEFHSDFKPALSAPTTEVTIMTRKPEVLNELLIGFVDTIAADIDAKNAKYAPVTWGQAKEQDHRYYLIAGWDSPEVHKKTVQDPSFHPFDNDLKSAATIKLHLPTLFHQFNMPVVEIVKATVSEAYKADPSILKPVFDFLVKVDGCLDVYAGVAEEDKKTFHLIVVWETLEHHRALQRTPGYPQIVGLGPVIEGELQMNHVEFNKEVWQALNAPITEFARLALKQGVQTATKDRLYEIWEEGGPKIDAKNKHAPAIWGQAVEDSDVFWFVCGWESVKVHTDVIHGDLANFAPLIGSIGEITDTTTLHVKLSKAA